MIDSAVFNKRLEICKACEHWVGACAKRHVLQSPLGCPIKKFKPVSPAGYAPDVPPNAMMPTPTVGCCGG